MDAVNVYVFQFLILANVCGVHLGSGVPNSPQQRRFIVDGGGLARLTCTFTSASCTMTTCHTTTFTGTTVQWHGRLAGLVDKKTNYSLEGFSPASSIESLTNEATALSLLGLIWTLQQTV